MNHSGQLTLIKTTLSAVPVYTSIILSLPPWMHKSLEKIMKVFLWTGTDIVQGGKCLVVWSRLQRPLQLGGVGILDPKLNGYDAPIEMVMAFSDPSLSWRP
jgi:hypothetical protein